MTVRTAARTRIRAYRGFIFPPAHPLTIRGCTLLSSDARTVGSRPTGPSSLTNQREKEIIRPVGEPQLFVKGRLHEEERIIGYGGRLVLRGRSRVPQLRTEALGPRWLGNLHGKRMSVE